MLVRFPAADDRLRRCLSATRWAVATRALSAKGVSGTVRTFSPKV